MVRWRCLVTPASAWSWAEYQPIMQFSVIITSVGHLVRVDLLTEDDITVHHLPGERHRVLDVHIVVASAVDHLNTQSELSIHNIHQSQRSIHGIHQSQRSILASPSRSCPSRPRRC